MADKESMVRAEYEELIKEMRREYEAKVKLAKDFVRAETLKEVGEWLTEQIKGGHLNRTVIEYLIENLMRGEMPE